MSLKEAARLEGASEAKEQSLTMLANSLRDIRMMDLSGSLSHVI